MFEQANLDNDDDLDDHNFDNCASVDQQRMTIVQRVNKFAFAVRQRFSSNKEFERVILWKLVSWVKHVEKTLHAHPWLTDPGNNQLRAAIFISEDQILPSPRLIPPAKKRTKDECSGMDTDTRPTPPAPMQSLQRTSCADPPTTSSAPSSRPHARFPKPQRGTRREGSRPAATQLRTPTRP